MARRRNTQNYISEIRLKSEIVKINNARKIRLQQEAYKYYDFNTTTTPTQTINLVKANQYLLELLEDEHNTCSRLSGVIDSCDKDTYKELIKEFDAHYNNCIDISEKVFIPNISREVYGEYVMQITTNLTKSAKFSGYTWHDDMRSLAHEYATKYIHNYNPRYLSPLTGRSGNAFAYITQIAYNAFVKIIKDNNASNAFVDNYIIPNATGSGDYKPDCSILRVSEWDDGSESNKTKTEEIIIHDNETLLDSLNVYITDDTIFKYPYSYKISLTEHAAIIELINNYKNVSVIRGKFKD